MGCLADVVDMLIEGQRAVYCDTQALYCCCVRNCGVSNLNSTDFFFRPVSCDGACQDCFSFVWIETKSICVQPIVYGLGEVIDNSDVVICVQPIVYGLGEVIDNSDGVISVERYV